MGRGALICGGGSDGFGCSSDDLCHVGECALCSFCAYKVPAVGEEVSVFRNSRLPRERIR